MHIRRLIFLVILIALLVIMFMRYERSEASTNTLSMTYSDATEMYASKYEIPHEWLYETIKGESGFKHEGVVHDGGKGRGCTGYWKSTFYSHKQKFQDKYPELTPLDYGKCLDQIQMMAVAMKEGRWWEWTEYCKKFGKRGTGCDWWFRKQDKLALSRAS